MKKTIQGFIVNMIDKYIAKYQFATTVCEVEMAAVFAYTMLWLGLPIVAGLFLAAEHHHALSLLCLSAMAINWLIFSDDEFFANKAFTALQAKRNKLLRIINSERRFRYLLKKSITGKLDNAEYDELRESLQKMCVDISCIPDIKTDFIVRADERITSEV